MSKLPPYGKQLMAQRMAGSAPDAVYITTDWNLAQAFCRIVIPDDLAADELEMRFLAGLDVCIVHHEADAQRIPKIADAVLKYNPRILNALNVDGEPRTTVLKRGAA